MNPINIQSYMGSDEVDPKVTEDSINEKVQ